MDEVAAAAAIAPAINLRQLLARAAFFLAFFPRARGDFRANQVTRPQVEALFRDSIVVEGDDGLPNPFTFVGTPAEYLSRLLERAAVVIPRVQRTPTPGELEGWVRRGVSNALVADFDALSAMGFRPPAWPLPLTLEGIADAEGDGGN